MSVLTIPNTYQQLVDYLAKYASPAQILAFAVSDEEQERAEYLLERNQQGELTLSEQLELEQMVYIDKVVALLKAKAFAEMNKA
jgi:ADP-heptose:LPS heptosyltransferase